MQIYVGKRKVDTIKVVSPTTYETEELQSYDKMILIQAESKEHAKQRLENEFEGDWIIKDEQ